MGKLFLLGLQFFQFSVAELSLVQLLEKGLVIFFFPVERVQILTSYTYASGLLGLSFFSSADEDGAAEDGKRYMVITLSLESEAK